MTGSGLHLNPDLPLLSLRRRAALQAADDGRLPEAEAELSDIIGNLRTSSTSRALSELAQTHHDRAVVRRYSNRFKEALADLYVAQELAENLPVLPRRSVLSSVLGARAALLAKPGTGVQDLDRALADVGMLRDIGLLQWLADEIECQIAHQCRAWATVVDTSRTLIEKFHERGFPAAVAFARLRLGEALVELGQLKPAAAEISFAVEFLEREGPPDRLATALLLWARIEAVRGDCTVAIELAERALSHLEGLIRQFRSLEDQQRFVHDKLRAYGHAFEIALLGGNENALWRAWSVAERAKSFYLCQLMANADVRLLDGVVPETARRLDCINDELSAVEARLGESDPGAKEGLLVEQGRLLREHGALLEQVMQANPAWASARTPRPVDVRAAVRSLGPGWSILAHFWRDTTEGALLSVFLADGSGRVMLREIVWSQAEVAELEDHVALVARDGHRNVFMPAVPHGLAMKIVPADVAALVARDQPLLISTHGVLAATALQALPLCDDEKLIERCPVVLIPTLAMLQVVIERPVPESVLVLACEQDGFQHRPLPDARKEVESLTRVWSDAGRSVEARVLDPHETLAAVGHPARTWGDHGLVHVACHGEFDVANPLNAALMLGADSLRAAEFFTVRLNADAVILSACDVGQRHISTVSSQRGFDEWIGFYIPLFYAGTRMLVTSRWKANSQQAARFMTALHRAMAEGQSVVQAVQTATLTLVGGPQMFWANWALVGVPTSTRLSEVCDA